MRVFLGLCSNLGEREMHLIEAKDRLLKYDVLTVGQSVVLETEPLGGLDQPLYLNQVIECRTELSPEALLQVCKTVETEMGRPTKHLPLGNVSFGSVKPEALPLAERWESRIIDIDILLYGDAVIQTPLLTIPHPAVNERDFVQKCLLDLDSNLMHPKRRILIRDML